MMEFRIHYRGWPGDGKSQATTGSITVTGEQVQISTRQSLVSARLYVWLLLLIVVLFFTLVPLSLFFGWVIRSAPLPAWVHFLFPWAFMVPFLAIFICIIPIYPRCMAASQKWWKLCLPLRAPELSFAICWRLPAVTLTQYTVQWTHLSH